MLSLILHIQILHADLYTFSQDFVEKIKDFLFDDSLIVILINVSRDDVRILLVTFLRVKVARSPFFSVITPSFLEQKEKSVEKAGNRNLQGFKNVFFIEFDLYMVTR